MLECGRMSLAPLGRAAAYRERRRQLGKPVRSEVQAATSAWRVGQRMTVRVAAGSRLWAGQLVTGVIEQIFWPGDPDREYYELRFGRFGLAKVRPLRSQARLAAGRKPHTVPGSVVKAAAAAT